VTRLWVDNGGSIPDRTLMFSSPPRPDRLCDPFGFLSNGYQGLLHQR